MPLPRTALETARCIDCGREYAGRAARPRWAFDHRGVLLGSVHTYHQSQIGRTYQYWTAEGGLSPEAARFHVWRNDVQGLLARRHEDAAAWMAALLAYGEEASTELSPHQRQRLAGWDVDHAGIEAAYRSMVAAYLAWRADLPDDGVAAGLAV